MRVRPSRARYGCVGLRWVELRWCSLGGVSAYARFVSWLVFSAFLVGFLGPFLVGVGCSRWSPWFALAGLVDSLLLISCILLGMHKFT